MPKFDAQGNVVPESGSVPNIDLSGDVAVDAPTPAPNNQALALQAAAQGGQNGLDIFNQARKDISSGQAAAVQRAQSLANIIGGPEAQGFEQLPKESYGRGLAALTAGETGFKASQQAGANALANYQAKVKAGIPMIEAQTAQLLAGYGKKKAKAAASSAAAKFPLANVVGSTNIAIEEANRKLPELQETVAKLTSDYDRAQKVLDNAAEEKANLEATMSDPKWKMAYVKGDPNAPKP